jgi:hypothetical protein
MTRKTYEDEPSEWDHRKQWLRLTPDLVEALQGLATQEKCSLEQLIISLIHEALIRRLRSR